MFFHSPLHVSVVECKTRGGIFELSLRFTRTLKYILCVARHQAKPKAVASIIIVILVIGTQYSHKLNILCLKLKC